jgi:hypothetical protein
MDGLCFLWGMDWMFKCYLDELQLQRVSSVGIAITTIRQMHFFCLSTSSCLRTIRQVQNLPFFFDAEVHLCSMLLRNTINLICTCVTTYMFIICWLIFYNSLIFSFQVCNNRLHNIWFSITKLLLVHEKYCTYIKRRKYTVNGEQNSFFYKPL